MKAVISNKGWNYMTQAKPVDLQTKLFFVHESLCWCGELVKTHHENRLKMLPHQVSFYYISNHDAAPSRCTKANFWYVLDNFCTADKRTIQSL